MKLSTYGSRLLYKRLLISVATLFIIVTLTDITQAQINPLTAIYYQNQYLTNPAMAGLKEGLCFNLSYRNQWNAMPGAPSEQAVTGSYRFGKAALGVNVSNEKAGLLKQTRAVGSYAYHLPLDGNARELHFGLSLGFMNERVDRSLINGDQNDVNIDRFNDRETYIDGDFGLAYTSDKITIQGAIPNLNNFFNREKRQAANYNTFFTAVSYKIRQSAGLDFIGIEPKVCFRGIKGNDNILDAGANVTLAQNKFSLLGMYHSSKSASFGIGINYKTLGITAVYDTESSALRTFTSGGFEIGLGINLP